MNLDRLKEVNQLSMLEASKALSKFLQGPVSVGMNRVEIKKAKDLTAGLNPEEVVIGITSSLTSDLMGKALFVFPKETAFALSDFSLKRPRGQTQSIQEEERCLLEEVGNIVVGNYLRAFSQGFGLKCLLHGAPDFYWDTLGSLINQVLASLVPVPLEDALFIEIIFSFEQAAVKGYMILLCEMKRLGEALEKL